MSVRHLVIVTLKTLQMPFKGCFGLSERSKPEPGFEHDSDSAEAPDSVNCENLKHSTDEEVAVLGGDTAPNKDDDFELEHVWKVWYYHRHNRQEAVHWMANQKVIFELRRARHVAQMIRSIVPLEDLDINQDIAVFRDNIEPWYEDPANQYGGQWTVALKKEDDYANKLERIWSAMLAFCLSPNPLYSNIVTGFSFAVRGSVYTKCYVWLTNCTDVDCILDIGTRIATLARLEDPFMFINNQTKKVMFSL